jgi:hypothetical protein
MNSAASDILDSGREAASDRQSPGKKARSAASPRGFEPLYGDFENKMRNADLAVIAAKLLERFGPVGAVLVPSGSVLGSRVTAT